jgi:hypothetical protein
LPSSTVANININRRTKHLIRLTKIKRPVIIINRCVCVCVCAVLIWTSKSIVTQKAKITKHPISAHINANQFASLCVLCRFCLYVSISLLIIDWPKAHHITINHNSQFVFYYPRLRLFYLSILTCLCLSLNILINDEINDNTAKYKIISNEFIFQFSI